MKKTVLGMLALCSVFAMMVVLSAPVEQEAFKSRHDTVKNATSNV